MFHGAIIPSWQHHNNLGCFFIRARELSILGEASEKAGKALNNHFSYLQEPHGCVSSSSQGPDPLFHMASAGNSWLRRREVSPEFVVYAVKNKQLIFQSRPRMSDFMSEAGERQMAAVEGEVV